jgi:putative transposase
MSKTAGINKDDDQSPGTEIGPMGRISVHCDLDSFCASTQEQVDFPLSVPPMNKPAFDELEQMFALARTPAAGRALVRQILETAPVRELQRRTDTVRTRYISRKMGCAFLAESRTVELAAMVWYEHDKSVSCFLPQPCKLDLLLSGVHGGRTRTQRTPDVFVIADGHFYLDEWRTEERLEGLAEKWPHRFLKDEQGRWRYIQAEERCRELGITHRLRSADELPRIFIDNMRFLED